MNVKKLDKRFRLHKQGLATHMVDLDVGVFGKAERIMNEAYGMPQAVPAWRKYIPRGSEWFYNSRFKKKQIRTQISTDIYGHAVYSDRVAEVLVYRIYFRREEQAMYLALKLS